MNHSISDKDLDVLNWCIDNTGFLSMDLENVSVALANLSISSDPVAQATVRTIATAISSYAQDAESLAETIESAYRSVMTATA